MQRLDLLKPREQPRGLSEKLFVVFAAFQPGDDRPLAHNAHLADCDVPFGGFEMAFDIL